MGKPAEISIVDVKAMPVEEKSALSVSPAAELCKAAMIAESRKDSEAGVYECVVPMKVRVRVSLDERGKPVDGIYNRGGTLSVCMDEIRDGAMAAIKLYNADNLVKPDSGTEWTQISDFTVRGG